MLTKKRRCNRHESRRLAPFAARLSLPPARLFAEKLLPREIVYDIWISGQLTGGRAWLAQVTSEALACSMAAEIEAGRLPVELRRIADGWSALWSGAVSSPQLADPGRGSC